MRDDNSSLPAEQSQVAGVTSWLIDTARRSLMTHHTSRRRAFTLFELLTALAAMLLLFALLLPAVARAKLAAVRAQSQNNLKQLALAVHNYASTFNVMPPGVDDNHFSTVAYLLPYLEQNNVFQM